MLVSATQPVAYAASQASSTAPEMSAVPEETKAPQEAVSSQEPASSETVASSEESTSSEAVASSEESTSSEAAASSEESTSSEAAASSEQSTSSEAAASSEQSASSEAAVSSQEPATSETKESTVESEAQDTVDAKEETEEQTAVQQITLDGAIYEDAALVDQWTGNQNGTVAVEDGWLHLVSKSGDNGNNQFYVVNESAAFSQQEGYLEFTIKPNSAPANSRFGIYLRSNGANDGLFIGYDPGGWFWQTYDGQANAYYSGSRIAAPASGQETKVRIDFTETKATVTINGQEAFAGGVDLSTLPSSRGGKLAIKAAQWNTSSTDVRLKEIHYEGQKEIATYQVAGVVTADGEPVEGATVQLGEQSVVTGKDGSYTLDYVRTGEYKITVSKEGFVSQSREVTIDQADLQNIDFELKSAAVQTISSEQMDVTIYDKFPAVKQYDFKSGELKGKTFYGQTVTPDTIELNGQSIVLTDEDVTLQTEGNKATYTMHVKDDTGIDCNITAVMTVEENMLSLEITDVQYNQENGKNEHPVQTIYFPNHSLVSVRSSQQNATFAGSKMSSNTRISGDTYKDVTKDLATGKTDYMYSFVSADGMSAAMESNSEYEGSNAASYIGAGGASNTRIWATVTDVNGEKSMGLGSALFYWNRALESKDESDASGQTNRTYVTEPTENPLVKIIITGNQNGDDTVDWQDGAIAFRSISHELYKSEEVPDRVAMRVVENFSSQATNPFMMTLDNVKRVYLNTDGLGQAVLLKGYANEGHDSAHPDYDDIGQRLGGVNDMNTLMQEGNKLGAYFGIHVNASEMYTEAKAFDELLAKRNASGGLSYGWNWLDQGIGIDSKFDLLSGRREARFDALYDKVGTNLNWVYVDVWGNGTGTLEDSWATRRLSDEITSNGWRMTTEWGPTNEYDSTFQHWATDLTYGGYQAKGYNSTIARFIRNHQKDSWVGDYTQYGGAANAPLLGGYDMKDFEGWQGRSNYDDYINNLFTNDLSTKFFQHFLVTKWVNDEAISTPYGNWAPEKEITLQDDTYGTVVVTRKDTKTYSEDVLSDYRDRTVTLNGKVILTGNASRSDNNQKGDETYLLPWFWDANGNDLAQDQQKLYHWNTQGGTTTWDLPDSWGNVANVVMYQLTDEGKTNAVTVPVVNGKVTLEAEAETPYVVYKGEQKQLEIGGWQGNHLYDTGFNTYDLTESKWKVVSGEPSIENTTSSNPMLILDSGEAASHTITDLTPGKTYALYIGVDNLSDAKAYMTVSSVNGTVLASNYTGRSIANNWVATDPHSNNIVTEKGTNGSRFQNMYVFFTADDTTATLTLSRDAGEGRTYFDNMRCVETQANYFTYNDAGDVVAFSQDFEHNVQGLYPFVIGPSEGVADNRTHLSELHAPYTQGGWDVKKGDDAIEGSWSVKTNGLVQLNNVVYQTIPQNFHFEPGYTYKVSFDYQAGSEGTYAVVVGDGTGYDATKAQPLHYKADENGVFETQTFEMEITGAADGQTWFGIYSTNVAANTQGTSGSAASFGDYQNLMLDNLRIERVETTVEKADLEQLLQQVAGYTFENTGCTAEEWTMFTKALAQANTVLAKENATQQEMEAAFNALQAAKIAVDNTTGLPASSDQNDIAVEELTASDGAHQSGQDATNVLDNDSDTVYHSPWNGTASENLWIQLDLKTPQTVNGLRYLPRQSGINGKLVEGKIQVKVQGSQDWITVAPKGTTTRADGTFTFGTGNDWQKAVFDAVDNVVSVRLTALNTMNDNSGNTYFSAAELRLTQPGAQGQEPAADKNELQSLVNAVNRLDESRYVKSGWALMQEKLQAAQDVLAKADATAQEIADATGALQDAMDALVMKAYLPQLEEKIAIAESMDEMDYMSGWEAFAEATAKLKELVQDPNATQEQANAALAAFYEAYQALVAAPDKTDLKQTIASVDELVQSVSSAAYTQESWQDLLNALQAAKETLANKQATLEQVEAATQQLKTALAGLKQSDEKTALQDLIAFVEKRMAELDQKLYTTNSWAALSSALENAKNTLADTKATTQDYSDAVSKLNSAYGDLALKGDATELKAEVDAAKAYQENAYTPSSWKALNNALQAAQALLNDADNATQAQLDAAKLQLRDARIGLVMRANKNELINAMNEANKKQQKDYTADSWAVFAKAKAEAETVYHNQDATQAQVDAARTALEQAMAGLKKAEFAQNQNNQNQNNTTSNAQTTNNQGNSVNAPKTGDGFSFAGMITAIAASMAGLIALGKKKSKKEEN